MLVFGRRSPVAQRGRVLSEHPYHPDGLYYRFQGMTRADAI